MPIKMVEVAGVIIEEARLNEAGYFKKEEAEKSAPAGRFKPKVGVDYHYQTSHGTFEVDTWTGGHSDQIRCEMDNCYGSAQEAREAYARQVALVRVQDKLEELTEEPLDWGQTSQPKYELFYDYEVPKVGIITQYNGRAINGLYGSEDACNWVRGNMLGDLELLAGVLICR